MMNPLRMATNTTSNDYITAPSTYTTTTCKSSNNADIIDWTYRTRRPAQPIPRGAHTPSTSIGSITTSSSCLSHSRTRSDFSSTAICKGVDAQAVIAKIMENDQANSGSYFASQHRSNKSQDSIEEGYPPRIDSRRALLSMANGAKAPMLLRGPSTNSSIHGKRGRTNRTPVIAPPLPVPKRSSAIQYLHKELPPTPPSSNSSSSADFSPASGIVPRSEKSALPKTKPLNLTLTESNNNSNSLAAKRLSRALNKPKGGSLALSRFRAVPAPIRLPPIRGPSAFNGPSSAHTSEDEDEPVPDAEIDELHLGEPLVRPQQQRKAVMTPMGELPITPLDIPVDWDDLHDRWTSPILVHPEQEEEEEERGQALLNAFHEDVGDLFAYTPTIEVGKSINGDDDSVFIAQVRSRKDESVAELSEDSDGAKKEKRHGKVMVKKELKLCLDMNATFKKRKGPKAGESFLMLTSPLSADTESLRASIVW